MANVLKGVGAVKQTSMIGRQMIAVGAPPAPQDGHGRFWSQLEETFVLVFKL